MERTALYRHFDEADRLLYVGISFSAMKRLKQHRDHAHWFDAIARVTIEWLPSREEALIAEATAIRDESPKYNIQRPTVNAEGGMARRQLPRSRTKLDTIEAVAVELARLYRRAVSGEVSIADCSKQANALELLSRPMLVERRSHLDSRLKALEMSQ